MTTKFDGTWTDTDDKVHTKDPVAKSAYDDEMSKMSDEDLTAYIAKLAGETPREQTAGSVDLKSMTDDQLMDYASKLEQGQSGENRYTDLSEYYIDRIESGITSTPSMVGASFKTLLVDPIEDIASQPFSETVSQFGGDLAKNTFNLMTKSSLPSLSNKENALEDLYQTFGENYMNYQHGYQELFNLDVDQTGKKPPNDIHRYLGSGVEAFSDPYGLLVKTGGKITTVLARAMGLQIVGMGAEGGGDLGGSLEESYTGEPETGSWRTIGALAATIPAATISAPVTSALFNTGGSAIRKFKEVKNNPNDAQKAFATTYVKGILNKIIEENPDIDVILKDLNKIGVKWDAGDFPLIAAANQSPTAHAELVKLARTNSSFRHGFQMELDRMKELVEVNADKIFGGRYTELPWSDTAIKKGMQARQQRLIKARSNIDDRIVNLQERLDPTMSDLDRGIAIEKLIAKRESLARAEVKPLYDELEWKADEMGVKIPSDAVEDFWRFVEENNARDLFGKGSEADIKIIKLLKPRNVKNEITGQETLQSPELTFSQVDSLKRLINKLKRETRDPSELRRVKQLDDAMGHTREDGSRGGLRSLLPEEFDLELKSIDKLYFEKVGLPFDAEAIAQIGKKRYSSEVANIILKNREALDQYMNVAGKEGPQLARDAMIAKLYTKTVVNGVLDRKKLAKELAKNKDVIDGIPGMRGELDKLQTDADYLGMRMGTLDDALKVERNKVADHFLTTSDFWPSYKKLAQGIVGSPQKRVKFFKDLKMLDSSTRTAVLERVRREFVETLKTQPMGAYHWLGDKANAKIINDIMGKGYTQDLKDFAKVIDAMHGIDVSKLGATINAQELDPVGKIAKGLDAKYVSSQIRDRISSITMKMTRLGSRMLDFKTKQNMDRSVFELLVDRDGMKKINNSVAKMDFNIDTPLKMKEITGLIKEILPVYMYTGLKTSVNHKAEEIEQKIQ